MAADQETNRIPTTAHGSYSARPGLILGFHGTDQSVVNDLVMHQTDLRSSCNSWDWLGHGVYFWENSPSRALEFAEMQSKRRTSLIKIPAVIGAVLNLNNCFDLLDYRNLKLLKYTYDCLDDELKLLQNKAVPGSETKDLLLRHLDCAVIERHHQNTQEKNDPPFDSVRAVFFEGRPLYPNAGFREKNHIQICIRNSSCIKGLFIPRFD